MLFSPVNHLLEKNGRIIIVKIKNSSTPYKMYSKTYGSIFVPQVSAGDIV